MFETSESITGSWYPSGFHGHFRSKTRNDFEISYRHHARPIPPQKFINRAQVRSDKHLFSKHDNRNSHASSMRDLEMHFSMGLGKRKPAPATSQHHKNTINLLHWNNNMNSSSNNHYQSSYQNSYRHLEPKTNIDKRACTTGGQGRKQFSMQHYHEPVHSRKNPELQRRLLTARPAFMKQSPPLLAWGPNTTDNLKNFKPCVGDSSRRTINRTQYEPVKTSTLITERL